MADYLTKALKALATEFGQAFSLVSKLKFTPKGGVFLVRRRDQKDFILKLFIGNGHQSRLLSEEKGLLLLAEVNIKTPTLFYSTNQDAYSLLLMEFIVSTEVVSPLKLAQQLCRLHSVTSQQYGLEVDNHIGTLCQNNRHRDSFHEFYILNRLQVQFQLAKENDLLQSIDEALIFKNIRAVLEEEIPTLIHGDLWFGNVISDNGNPVFIDPAICYFHREMDLAMMQLFGGFDRRVFEIYNELKPLRHGWEERLELYQLYYQLVHLNLFGLSYLSEVKIVLDKFS